MKDFVDEPSPKQKGPIFLERGDGLGWTLNFDRPVSYVILIVFLAALLTTVLFLNGVFHF